MLDKPFNTDHPDDNKIVIIDFGTYTTVKNDKPRKGKTSEVYSSLY